MSQPTLSRVLEARQHLVEGREEIRKSHAAGARSLEVAAALTDLVDRVVTDLALAVFADVGPGSFLLVQQEVALVALGGYGRRDLAPYSDVDLLLLYRPHQEELAGKICARLVQDYWDAGLQLGWSSRSVADTVALARKDVSVHTALLEARHLLGQSGLTDELNREVARLTRGPLCNAFIDAALAERAREQAKYGSTSHLLEPDLKKTRGGLRELHLLRWLARARYGFADLDHLQSAWHLSAADAEVLRSAHAFLLRIRHELHFQAGRAQDALRLDEQVRIAAAFGFQDRAGLRAVEVFMQHYYRHCDALDEVVSHFANHCRTRTTWQRLYDALTARTVGPGFVLAGGRLRLARGSRGRVFFSLQQVVDLFWWLNQHGAPLDPELRDRIRSALPGWRGWDTADACRTFLALLGRPGRLGTILQEMHRLGVLEQLIPEFEHARGLIQFNQYHKYTVDEHTLLCVANAERLLQDPSPLGEVYREVRRKDVLHLALLLHDIGKGFERDHSEVGRDLALRVALRFGLDPELREVLVFLVYRHLLLSHLTFRRDTSDERLLANFARQVGTPEVLKMLYVLTAVDTMSVGPDTWTSWKAEVLHDLYTRTLELLGGRAAVPQAEKKVAAVCDQVAAALRGGLPDLWVRAHLEAMRRDYLLATPVAQLVEQLRVIHALPAGEVVTTSTYDPATGVTVYTVHTFESVTAGLFAKITGVLAGKGLQILRARIATHKDGVVVDQFEVHDPHHQGEPPAARQLEVAGWVREVVLGRQTVEGLFSRRYRVGPASRSVPATHQEPAKVEIDNSTSDHATIVEVFAQDHQGLLYRIARTLFELGLDVTSARITTSLDQVLDVFYVTDARQHKITDRKQVEAIRQALLAAADQVEGPA